MSTITQSISYVLPVSDDGGSTAEIVRVLGGPAVGDIRSRCLRLADCSDAESQAVVRLLHFRLSASDEAAAKGEWDRIVAGEHPLWEGISDQYRNIIRRFLILFDAQVLEASLRFALGRKATQFQYLNGSIGNFFFAGARMFFRSLDAAIFLFSRVARIPEGSQVLPAILTDDIITLGAACTDGTIIRGQNNISHPAVSDPTVVDKEGGQQQLGAPIQRIFYLSSEGTHQEHEVFPRVNPQVVGALRQSAAIIYGMGSLFTSICPSLALEGVGEAVAGRACRKLLILNGSHDRESSRSPSTWQPMTAVDVVWAVTSTLNRTHSPRNNCLHHPPSRYVDTLIAPEGGVIAVDEAELRLLGITHVVYVPAVQSGTDRMVYDTSALVAALRREVGPAFAEELGEGALLSQLSSECEFSGSTRVASFGP